MADAEEKCEYPWCRSTEIALIFLGKPLCYKHQAPPGDDDDAVNKWRADLKLPPRKVLTQEEFRALGLMNLSGSAPGPVPVQAPPL